MTDRMVSDSYVPGQMEKTYTERVWKKKTIVRLELTEEKILPKS